jgi:hypothetical protein
VDRTRSDVYAWSDTACHARTAALLPNDRPDAFGQSGGYVRRFTYSAGGARRRCTGTGENGWEGFGYVVAHYGTDNLDVNTKSTLGTSTIVLAGRHHAIHEFSWALSPGGPVQVTAQWFFATGRDHPIFTITLDSSRAGPNVVLADSRAPYGDIGWDDDVVGEVAGVGWGDAYQFRTTGSGPVAPTSSWDYSERNVVPYAMEWSTTLDAEMGLVATQAWATTVLGGDYGDGLLGEAWGTTGSNLLTALPDWLWPFQLNQYELPFEATSHRVAWGSTFGAVGQTTYTAFGKSLSGYPFYGYSLFVVLGEHTSSAVLAAAQEIETVQTAVLTASGAVVSTEGPAGIARTDSRPYAPAGFDPVYAAWDVQLAGGKASLTLSVPTGALTNPVFHLHGYTASSPPSSMTLDGSPLTADRDYFASVDPATKSLWVTLDAVVAGVETLTIDP